jgi:hypothetical protein
MNGTDGGAVSCLGQVEGERNRFSSRKPLCDEWVDNGAGFLLVLAVSEVHQPQ